MSQLMYNSAKDVLINRENMRDLQTPAPMGAKHAPYSFAEFADSICDSIVESGFKIVQEEFAVSKDHMRLHGMLHVSNDYAASPVPNANGALIRYQPDTIPAPLWNLTVGVRGAHDQSIARGICFGSSVISCTNLCFHGDLGNWKSKQTTNIAARIPGMVRDAVSGLRGAAENLTVDFDGFNRTALTREEGDSVLLDIFMSGGFSASQLGRAIEDWDTCSVPEHTANGRNLWWLMQSSTHALKPTRGQQNYNHDDLRDRSTIIYNKMRPAIRALAA